MIKAGGELRSALNVNEWRRQKERERKRGREGERGGERTRMALFKPFEGKVKQERPQKVLIAELQDFPTVFKCEKKVCCRKLVLMQN